MEYSRNNKLNAVGMRQTVEEKARKVGWGRL